MTHIRFDEREEVRCIGTSKTVTKKNEKKKIKQPPPKNVPRDYDDILTRYLPKMTLSIENYACPPEFEKSVPEDGDVIDCTYSNLYLKDFFEGRYLDHYEDVIDEQEEKFGDTPITAEDSYFSIMQSYKGGRLIYYSQLIDDISLIGFEFSQTGEIEKVSLKLMDMDVNYTEFRNNQIYSYSLYTNIVDYYSKHILEEYESEDDSHKLDFFGYKGVKLLAKNQIFKNSYQAFNSIMYDICHKYSDQKACEIGRTLVDQPYPLNREVERVSDYLSDDL